MELNARKLRLKISARKNAISIIIIAIAVFLGFDPLFQLANSKIAVNIISAAFGTIFVIVITMYLLNKQTEIESENNRGEKIFEEKMKIYSDILNKSREMIEDGVLKKDEMVQAMFQSIQLQMIADNKTIDAYKEVYKEILKVFGENDDDEVDIDMKNQGNILLRLHDFASACRVDLEVSENAPDEKVSDEWSQLLQSTNEKVNTKDFSQFKFNGKEFSKTHFPREVLMYYSKNHPNLSSEDLLKVFPAWLAHDKGIEWAEKNTKKLIIEIENAKEHLEKSGHTRYQGLKKDSTIDESYVLNLSDGKFLVRRGWGIKNFPHFYNHCKTIPEIADKIS